MAEFTFYPEFAEYVALHHGVTSVNSKTGDVVLYGSDIPISSTDATSIAEKITYITNNIATTAEIDALFA